MKFFQTVLAATAAASVSAQSNYFAILNNVQPVDKPLCESKAHGSAVATFEDGQLCVRMNMNGVVKETLTRIEGPAEIGEDGDIKYRLPLGNQKIDCVSITDAADLAYLQSGLMNINVRSIMCPQGEIRGQLMMT